MSDTGIDFLLVGETDLRGGPYIRVGNDLHFFFHPGQDFPKSTGMVSMAMTEDDLIHTGQINIACVLLRGHSTSEFDS